MPSLFGIPLSIILFCTLLSLYHVRGQEILLDEPEPSAPGRVNFLESDSVWLGSGTSFIQLVHTAMIECTDPLDCPQCWVAQYRPISEDFDKTPPTQFPAHVGIIFQDYLDQPVSFYERPSRENNYVITSTPIPMTMKQESQYAMEVQTFINFPQNYDATMDYTGELILKSDNSCGSSPVRTPQTVTVRFEVDSPKKMQRNEVSTYFFNRYIPGRPFYDTKPPPGLDPRRNHAEVQVAAWYNWELDPAPKVGDADYPNLIDLRLYGSSYFVINETYTTSTQVNTLCWINSVPVLVEIDLRTNQTLFVHTQPRLDLHNPESALAQPIPLASTHMDAFRSRYFMELTCQDRLLIVYNEDNVRRDVLVYVVGYQDPVTGARTYRKERFPQSLTDIAEHVHGPTPKEVTGRALHDNNHHVLVCRTTIDFHSTTWLDDTIDSNIVVGIDGVTYTPDEPGAKTQRSSALFSLLPDAGTYPDIANPSPKTKDQIAHPILFVSDVSSTAVSGPFISFQVPSIRPYTQGTKTPSSQIQINIIFNVQNPVFHHETPSCSIIMHNLRSGDSKLSYSTSQYMNATVAYNSDQNQTNLRALRSKQQTLQTEPGSLATHVRSHHITPNKLYPINSGSDSLESKIPSPPIPTSISLQFLNSIKSAFNTTLFAVDAWLQSQLNNPSSSEFISSPQDIPSQSLPGESGAMETQGYKYPSTEDPRTRITITSRRLFGSYHVKIHNPNHIDFDYIGVNSLPGLTRFSFNSKVKNLVNNDPNQFQTTKTENRPELWTNDEQFIIPCRYAHDRSLVLQGALSIFSHEFQIGPINHDVIMRRDSIEIICDGIGLVSETDGHQIADYSYDTNSILNPNYPLSKTLSELKLKQWEHFVILLTMIDIKTPNQPVTSSPFSLLQQPIQSQVYLTTLASFAMEQPVKTYTALILSIVGGCVLAIFLILAILPVRRYFETRRDKKRQDAVKIEIGGVSSIPFEELGNDDNDQLEEDEIGYNNHIYH